MQYSRLEGRISNRPDVGYRRRQRKFQRPLTRWLDYLAQIMVPSDMGLNELLPEVAKGPCKYVRKDASESARY